MMLGHVPIREVMSKEIIVVSPGSSLGSVARTMLDRHVHSVVVAHPRAIAADPRTGWQVVSALEVLEARADPASPVGTIARSPALIVTEDETVTRAADLLSQHRVGHLLVTRFDGHPVGIVSSLDLLRGLVERAPGGDGAPRGRREASPHT